MTGVINDRPAHPGNYGARGGHCIKLIVVHADASPSMSATIDWLKDPAAKVSYHYSIGRSGWICRHVPDDMNAWHAGVSDFKNLAVGKSLNKVSIGVNLSNRQNGVEPFPEEQLDQAALLIHDLTKKYGIPLGYVVTHAQVALPKGRKHDPWPNAPGSMMDLMTRVQELQGV